MSAYSRVQLSFPGKVQQHSSVQLHQLRSVSPQTVAVLCRQECAGPTVAGFITMTTPIPESGWSGRNPGISISWDQHWCRFWDTSIAKVANGHNGESCWGFPALLFLMRWDSSEGSPHGVKLLWTVGRDNSGKICPVLRMWHSQFLRMFLSSTGFLLLLCYSLELSLSYFCWCVIIYGFCCFYNRNNC